MSKYLKETKQTQSNIIILGLFFKSFRNIFVNIRRPTYFTECIYALL